MSGDEDYLDEELPLGDGAADCAAMVTCPSCGQPSEIALDPGGGESQEYVEDCQVCCRPWTVRLRFLSDGSAQVWVEPADS